MNEIKLLFTFRDSCFVFFLLAFLFLLREPIVLRTSSILHPNETTEALFSAAASVLYSGCSNFD